MRREYELTKIIVKINKMKDELIHNRTVWACFKTEQTESSKEDCKHETQHPIGGQRSRREQQTKKYVMQTEGRAWEVREEVQLSENEDRLRYCAVGQPMEKWRTSKEEAEHKEEKDIAPVQHGTLL
jgi:hypothetical protein